MDSGWIYVGFVVLIQCCTAVWWSSNIQTRVRQLERDKDHLYEEVNGIGLLDTRVSVMEEGMKNIEQYLREIRDSLKGK